MLTHRLGQRIRPGHGRTRLLGHRPPSCRPSVTSGAGRLSLDRRRGPDPAHHPTCPFCRRCSDPGHQRCPSCRPDRVLHLCHPSQSRPVGCGHLLDGLPCGFHRLDHHRIACPRHHVHVHVHVRVHGRTPPTEFFSVLRPSGTPRPELAAWFLFLGHL